MPIQKYRSNSFESPHPFGMVMPGRAFNGGAYRYGFNGMEKDDEISVEGALISAEFWEYDCRNARRWNIDPIFKEWESRYLTFSGNPILYKDPSGADLGIVTGGTHDANNNLNQKVDEGAKKDFDEFMSAFKNIFHDKIDITTKAPAGYSPGDETLISKIAVKEGETLNEQEQAAFDFYSQIINNTQTTWVSLNPCSYGGPDKGQFFTIKDDAKPVSEDYIKKWGDCGGFNSNAVVQYNMQIISSVNQSGTAKTLFTPGDIITLGLALQTKNLDGFNKMVQHQVEKVGYTAFAVAFNYNYATNYIKLTNGELIKYKVKLTENKTRLVSGPSTVNVKISMQDKPDNKLRIDAVDVDIPKK